MNCCNMNVRIKPARLSGSVTIPPSKSLAHRAIIAASMAEGISKISNIQYSEDIKATISGMRALGADIREFSNYLLIKGGKVRRCEKHIFANESGSTLRFLIPIALISELPVEFSGAGKLPLRPLDLYFELFDKFNIKYSHPEGKYLPLKLEGSLKPGVYEIRGDVSSQFITGLLYTLPNLNGDSKIVITTKLESKGYIDLTIDVLKTFGIDINFNENEIIIKGNQAFKPCDYMVEGDYSQAAFYLLANMLGNDITLKGMRLDSYQGDKKILEDIKAFGGDIITTSEGLKAIPLNLKGAQISFAQSPDLGPALTVLASVCEGDSHFYDAERLRIKECDRITCVKDELTKLGAIVTEYESGMNIVGSKLHGGEVSSHNDHRLAMAFSMISTIIDDDLVITDAQSVKKSYPDFWEVFERLGGKISYE